MIETICVGVANSGLANVILNVLVRDAMSERTFTLVAITLPPYASGTPLHIHPRHSEGYYVLTGTLALTQNNATVTLANGAAARVQPGVAHTFWNPTATTTTILLIYTPGGAVEEVVVPTDD